MKRLFDHIHLITRFARSVTILIAEDRTVTKEMARSCMGTGQLWTFMQTFNTDTFKVMGPENEEQIWIFNGFFHEIIIDNISYFKDDITNKNQGLYWILDACMLLIEDLATEEVLRVIEDEEDYNIRHDPYKEIDDMNMLMQLPYYMRMMSQMNMKCGNMFTSTTRDIKSNQAP